MTGSRLTRWPGDPNNAKADGASRQQRRPQASAGSQSVESAMRALFRRRQPRGSPARAGSRCFR